MHIALLQQWRQDTDCSNTVLAMARGAVTCGSAAVTVPGRVLVTHACNGITVFAVSLEQDMHSEVAAAYLARGTGRDRPASHSSMLTVQEAGTPRANQCSGTLQSCAYSWLYHAVGRALGTAQGQRLAMQQRQAECTGDNMTEQATV